MDTKDHIEPNAVYTYSDLERILDVSKRTLSFYVDKKEIHPIVFGNKYRFLGKEILRFLEQRMTSFSNGQISIT